MSASPRSEWDLNSYAYRKLYRLDENRCASEEGIAKLLANYALWGKRVLSHRVTPIGPWCVYWTRAYPGGFCVEAEIVPRA